MSEVAFAFEGRLRTILNRRIGRLVVKGRFCKKQYCSILIYVLLKFETMFKRI